MARKNLDAVKEIEIVLENNKFMASSMQIAKHFKKSHDNVLRDIRNLIQELPAEWASINFEDINVSTDLGHATRQDPAYMVTRDGFVMLAMGFTGKEALEWKMKYIEAFNQMESALLERLQKEKALMEKKVAALEGSDKQLKFLLNGLTEHIESFYVMEPDKRTIILRGLLAYWAYLDNISLKTAENILLAAAEISQWSETGHSYDKCNNLISRFITKVSLSENQESALASQQEILLALADACKLFTRFTWNNADQNGISQLSKGYTDRLIHIFFAELTRLKAHGAHIESLKKLMAKQE